MLKIVIIFILSVFIGYGYSSPLVEHPRNTRLELFEETNRNTILNERDSYAAQEKLNILARNSELGEQTNLRRMRRGKTSESDEVIRRPDSEYQAFLGPDYILPDNWRSLYSEAGLRRLSPCSS